MKRSAIQGSVYTTNILEMIFRSFLLIIFIHPVLSKAGTLDDFESAKQESPLEERSEDSHDRMSYSDEEGDSFSEQLMKFMFEGFWYLALYGVDNSLMSGN